MRLLSVSEQEKIRVLGFYCEEQMGIKGVLRA